MEPQGIIWNHKEQWKTSKNHRNLLKTIENHREQKRTTENQKKTMENQPERENHDGW
jgi:hypothetical protein